MNLPSLLPLSEESLAVYGALHSLNNFLSVVLGHSQFLASGGSVYPQDDLAVIVQAARDAQQMVHRLMHGTDDLVWRHSEVAVGAIVHDLAQGLHISADERNVAIQAQIPEGLSIRMDAVQLREILLNLMRNAIQAMPNGGTLSIHAYSDDRTVRVAVSDTGVGMCPGQVGSLFSSMKQSRWGGQGIGLLTSQLYAHAAGGFLQAHSALAEGTTVTLTLPRAGAELAMPDRGTAEFPADAHLCHAGSSGRY